MNHLVEFTQLIGILERDLLVPTTDPLEAFRLTLTRHELVRKLEPHRKDNKVVDTKQVALDSFLQQEEINRETNKRFSPGAPDLDTFSSSVLYTAARLIRKVLGDSPRIDDILRQCTHGPGVTIGCGGDRTSLHFKATSALTSTTKLIPFARHLVASDDLLYSIHNGNPIIPVRRGELFAVPKDNTTDRICEKQPTLNVFLQKGIGSEIRRRLRSKCNINLNDQGVNAMLARKGSIEGNLATIDLSNASNSITYGVVRELLPHPWFVLLDIARTDSVVLLDGTNHDLQLFSAMGNGFTFELESLIFWALVKAVQAVSSNVCRDSTVSVYGDDLIFDKVIFDEVTRVFGVFGFSVNERKSHISGPFRESCGSYWYNGFNVKPLRLRSYPRSRLCWIRLANMIYERARNWGEELYAHPVLFNAWRYAVNSAVKRGAQFGPVNVEGVIHGFDERRHNSSYRGRSKNGLILRKREMELGRFVNVAPNIYVQIARVRGSQFEPDGVHSKPGKEPIRRNTRVRRTICEFFADDWGVPFLP